MAKAKLNANTTPAVTDEAEGASLQPGMAEEGAAGAPTGQQLTQVDHFLDGLIMVSGALFTYEPKDGEVTEGSPTMTGTMLIGETRRVGVALWTRVAEETGVTYAEISVGDRGKSKYHGRMFRNTNRDGNPTYGGFITLLPVEHAKQYTAEEWDAAPKLDIFGIARRNRADGKVRIGLTFTDGVVARDDVPF